MQLVIEGSSIDEIEAQVVKVYAYFVGKRPNFLVQPPETTDNNTENTTQAQSLSKPQDLPQKEIKKRGIRHPLKPTARVRLNGKIKVTGQDAQRVTVEEFITPEQPEQMESPDETETSTQDFKDDNEATLSGSAPGSDIDPSEASAFGDQVQTDGDEAREEQTQSTQAIEKEADKEEVKVPKKKVQEFLQRVYDEKGLTKAREVLDGFGYRVLREVPESQYAEVLAKCKKVLKS